MQQDEAKSVSQYIIDALLTGEWLTIRDIAEMIYATSNRRVASQDVASMMARIQNGQKCDLGFFINRVKDQKHFVYRIVPEMLQVPVDKIYSLARRTGKDRYSLSQVMTDFPQLRQYVDKSKLEEAQSEERARGIAKKPDAETGSKQRRAPAATRKSTAAIRAGARDGVPAKKIKSTQAVTQQPEAPAPDSTAAERLADKAMSALRQAAVLSVPEEVRIDLNLNVTISFEGFKLTSG